MRRLFLLGLVIGTVLCEDLWSPEEGGAASFEPSVTVLEQWSGLDDRSDSPTAGDRTDKVMKKPDRYIVNRPPKEPPVYAGSSKDKEVSETDLFLLGAIEKLAYRMEYLEKRLLRTEEMLYQFIAGNQFDDKVDPCPENFRRYGNACYHVSSKQVNWKSASSMCRNLNSALLEFETVDEEKSVFKTLLQDPNYQGKDFWTGGLNPGLLWIWSNSAKPVLTNATHTADNKQIDGSGRCLLLKYQALSKTYVYKGIDCSARNYYVCRYMENSVARKLDRLQRQLRLRNDSENASDQP